MKTLFDTEAKPNMEMSYYDLGFAVNTNVQMLYCTYLAVHGGSIVLFELH